MLDVDPLRRNLIGGACAMSYLMCLASAAMPEDSDYVKPLSPIPTQIKNLSFYTSPACWPSQVAGSVYGGASKLGGGKRPQAAALQSACSALHPPGRVIIQTPKGERVSAHREWTRCLLPASCLLTPARHSSLITRHCS